LVEVRAARSSGLPGALDSHFLFVVLHRRP